MIYPVTHRCFFPMKSPLKIIISPFHLPLINSPQKPLVDNHISWTKMVFYLWGLGILMGPTLTPPTNSCARSSTQPPSAKNGRRRPKRLVTTWQTKWPSFPWYLHLKFCGLPKGQHCHRCGKSMVSHSENDLLSYFPIWKNKIYLHGGFSTSMAMFTGGNQL
jgi:hypothetical protein